MMSFSAWATGPYEKWSVRVMTLNLETSAILYEEFNETNATLTGYHSDGLTARNQIALEVLGNEMTGRKAMEIVLYSRDARLKRGSHLKMKSYDDPTGHISIVYDDGTGVTPCPYPAKNLLNEAKVFKYKLGAFSREVRKTQFVVNETCSATDAWVRTTTVLIER